MVIEEAKILNKKIIITDTAAKEALDGDNDGVIIGNSEECIYEKLKEIINKRVVFYGKKSICEDKRIKEIIDLLDN